MASTPVSALRSSSHSPLDNLMDGYWKSATYHHLSLHTFSAKSSAGLQLPYPCYPDEPLPTAQSETLVVDAC